MNPVKYLKDPAFIVAAGLIAVAAVAAWNRLAVPAIAARTGTDATA